MAEAEAALAAAAQRGNALEIASGTGLWTRHLAPRVEQLLALDAAEEPLAIARTRVTAPNVEQCSEPVDQPGGWRERAYLPEDDLNRLV